MNNLYFHHCVMLGFVVDLYQGHLRNVTYLELVNHSNDQVWTQLDCSISIPHEKCLHFMTCLQQSPREAPGPCWSKAICMLLNIFILGAQIKWNINNQSNQVKQLKSEYYRSKWQLILNTDANWSWLIFNIDANSSWLI